MERLSYGALGDVVDNYEYDDDEEDDVVASKKRGRRKIAQDQENVEVEEQDETLTEPVMEVNQSVPYEPNLLWRIGTVVVVKTCPQKKKRGHIIMHIRGGITTHYALQKVRVLYDRRQGSKTYEDVDVSCATAAASALATVVGAPRVEVRMWTSGTPCMRREALEHAARIPDAADKERGFGVSSHKVNRAKGGFSGSSASFAALTRAEAKAKRHLDSKKPLTDAEVLDALSELGDEEWPHQDRPNVSAKPVRGMMLGAVFVLGGVGMAASNICENFPHLTKLVTGWVKSSIPHKGFPFSSIQINYCYAAKKHVDGNNLGPSYIRAIGDHTGGALWIADKYVFDDQVDPTTGLKMIRGGGGSGELDARSDWVLFNGNEEHYTMPYKGRTRISFIVFSHHAYNKLPKDVASSLKELGFTAASSDYVDLDYFRRFRVDKKEFDADQNSLYFRFQSQRARDLPPPASPKNRVAVECYGLTMARGGGWMSFNDGEQTTVVELTPNMTGLHALHLTMDDKEGKLTEVSRHVDRARFNTYGKTEEETNRFCKWVDSLPVGDIVLVGISDTAIAAKRPPGESLYSAFRKMGAPKHIQRIGYRFPFCFVGVKGAPENSAILLMGKTKHLLRAEATVHLSQEKNKIPELKEPTTETTDITTAVIVPQQQQQDDA